MIKCKIGYKKSKNGKTKIKKNKLDFKLNIHIQTKEEREDKNVK